MKNLTTVLIVLIVLSGLGLGVAFFVLRNKKEDQEPQLPNSTKQTTESSTLNKPSGVNKSIPSDISIPHIDTLNRRFEFSMNYLGIQHKGEFIEGVAIAPFIKKSFGTFRIRQRASEMKKVQVPKDKNDKIRGGSSPTKGDKIKGNVTQFITVEVLTPSDWVDLEIRDHKNRLLNGLSVNLATGATIGAVPSTEWDGD